MKKEKSEVIVILAMFLLGMVFNHYIERIYDRYEETKPKVSLVWNDTNESIPKDGSFVKIQYTDEDTVFLGPIEFTDADCEHLNSLSSNEN